MKEKHYKAFILYSHKDNKIGEWLEESLENYKIPKDLKEDNSSVSTVSSPLFLEKEKLFTSSKLENSEYLIIVCSVNSAKSQWVHKKIIDFKKIHGENKIIAIIIEDEPYDKNIEYFSKALKYKVVDGELSDISSEPIVKKIKKDEILKWITIFFGLESKSNIYKIYKKLIKIKKNRSSKRMMEVEAVSKYSNSEDRDIFKHKHHFDCMIIRDYFKKTDHINFSIFAPKDIQHNDSFALNVWAYLPEQFDDVKNIIKETSSKSQRNLAIESKVKVKIGSLLSLELELDGFKIEQNIDTILWEGEPRNAIFLITAPSSNIKKHYQGKVNIKYKGMLISTIKFVIEIENGMNKEIVEIPLETFIPKTAFASYSSRDRAEVFLILQGVKKILPDLNIFIDRISLDSGDNWEKELKKHIPNKDVFYLFWSVSSSQSKEVEKEWRFALEKRGLNYINPIPLDEPENAPPPKELSSLHFNDCYLTYIKYEKLKKFYHLRHLKKILQF